VTKDYTWYRRPSNSPRECQNTFSKDQRPVTCILGDLFENQSILDRNGHQVSFWDHAYKL